jgi:hypothetical protein
MMHSTNISSQPTVFKRREFSAIRHARNGNCIGLLASIRFIPKIYSEFVYKLDYR